MARRRGRRRPPWRVRVQGLRPEPGHLHGDHAAHFSFPRDVWAELSEQGRITDHPVFPGRVGLAARRIESQDDVDEVIALMRLNYDRITSRAAA